VRKVFRYQLRPTTFNLHAGSKKEEEADKGGQTSPSGDGDCITRGDRKKTKKSVKYYNKSERSRVVVLKTERGEESEKKQCFSHGPIH